MNKKRIDDLDFNFETDWSLRLNRLITTRLFLGISAPEMASTCCVCRKTIYNFEKEITRDARLMSYYEQILGGND